MSQVLALASIGLLAVAALDLDAHAQTAFGQAQTVASSAVPKSRPLSTTRQPAPPLYCLTTSGACDNTEENTWEAVKHHAAAGATSLLSYDIRGLRQYGENT